MLSVMILSKEDSCYISSFSTCAGINNHKFIAINDQAIQLYIIPILLMIDIKIKV